MKNHTRLVVFATGMALLLGMSGCRLLFPWAYPSADETLEHNRETLETIHATGQAVTIDDDAFAFSEAFMQTFAVERGDGVASWVGTTLLPVARRSAQPAATVPVDTTAISFSETGGTLSDYPEPGQTTTYTISEAPSVGATAYFISSVTTYPAASMMASYTEEYYVDDRSEGSDTADGLWDEHDPIVDETGTVDRLARVTQQVTFRDGSIRYETLVDLDFGATGDIGFAPFELLDDLSYPEFFYPASDDDAIYSSVIVYTHVRNTDHDFSFWEGTESQDILGVRFYTEHFVDGGDTYRGTLIAFEKVISTFVTGNENFATQLEDVFIGSEHTTLAESVFRKEVLFPVVDGTIQQTATDSNSVMRSHVVDVSQAADFQLQLLNDESLVLLDWDQPTSYIPDGQADEIIADAVDPEGLELLVQTVATNPDGTDVPLITSSVGISDLATLYVSINNQAETGPIDPGNDIPNTIDGDGELLSFDGEQGSVIPDGTITDPISEGTVEAWVYVTEKPNWSGIVHKGEQSDFSDEAYSLQFWGRNGTVSFAIVEQSPRYNYDVTKSKKRLNTNRWYYVVGTWDATTVRIYVDGVEESSTDNTIGEPYDSPGPLVIGSQLYSDDSVLKNYYGFNGKINGVRVTDRALSAEEIADNYTTYSPLTASW